MPWIMPRIREQSVTHSAPDKRKRHIQSKLILSPANFFHHLLFHGSHAILQRDWKTTKLECHSSPRKHFYSDSRHNLWNHDLLPRPLPWLSTWGMLCILDFLASNVTFNRDMSKAFHCGNIFSLIYKDICSFANVQLVQYSAVWEGMLIGLCLKRSIVLFLLNRQNWMLFKLLGVFQCFNDILTTILHRR